MKTFKKLLSFAAALVLFLSLWGCNKELQPIVLTGSWELDTASVIVHIVYNNEVAADYPQTITFLQRNIHNIRREIMKPKTIVFRLPNITESYYNLVPLPVVGTYTQENAYFTIVNAMFPNGISGASDNIRLELYYDRDHLMNILYLLLTDQDDHPSVYNSLIETYHGVGSYRKVN